MEGVTARTRGALVLDDEVAAVVRAGVPIVIGTCDADNRPSVTRGWAASVEDGGATVALFVSRAQSETTLVDLETNGRIAVTFSRPRDYLTFQLKGTCTHIGDADEADVLRVERYWDALVQSLGEIGVPERLSRGMWCEGLVRVAFRVEHCYRQTPGPKAGEEV